MNKNARIAAITAEAENSFSNFAGSNANELVGIHDSAYGNMSGAMAPVIDVDSAVRELTATIENTDPDHALLCPLFSTSEGFQTPF